MSTVDLYQGMYVQVHGSSKFHIAFM